MTNLSAPLVFVIAPCYNYSHFLLETIASLQHQKYQNWECIVVDDGSKDATLFNCSTDRLDRTWMPCISGKCTDMLCKLRRENIMLVNSPMLRRRLMLQVDEFDESLRACEDRDYWTRCAVAGVTFHYDDADDAAALVRAHATSLVNETPQMRQARIAMRLRASTLTAVARDNDIKAINTHNLLAVIC